MNMSNFLYKDNKKLILQCLLLGLLIVVGLWVPQLNIVALFAAIFCILSSGKEDILCLTAFLVSFSPIFKITLGGFTLFNVIIIVDVLQGLYLSKYRLRKDATRFFFILAFYVFITGFGNNIIEVLTVLCYLFLVVIYYSPGTISMHKLVTFTTWGIMMTSVVALLKDYFPRLLQIIDDATIRLSAGVYYYRFTGVEYNPNYYSLMISVCIGALIVLFIEGRNKKIDFLYAGILIFFGLLTVSQSFIVTFTICLLVACITVGGSGNHKAPVTIVAFIIVAIIAFTFLGDDVVNTILLRFERASAADSIAQVTSGRTDLQLYYLKYILNNVWVLLFGRGIGAAILPMGASHNFYIDIVYHLGIVGGLLYIGYLYIAFFRNIGVRKKKVYYYLPFFCFLTRAFAINLISRENLIFVLLICSTTLFDKKE